MFNSYVTLITKKEGMKNMLLIYKSPVKVASNTDNSTASNFLYIQQGIFLITLHQMWKIAEKDQE